MSKRAFQEVEDNGGNNDDLDSNEKQKSKQGKEEISFDIKQAYLKDCNEIYINLMTIPFMEVEIAKIIAQMGCSHRESCANCKTLVLLDDDEKNISYKTCPVYMVRIYDGDSIDDEWITFSHALMDANLKKPKYFVINKYIHGDNKYQILCTDCEPNVLCCKKPNHGMRCWQCDEPTCTECIGAVHVNRLGEKDGDQDMFRAICGSCNCAWC